MSIYFEVCQTKLQIVQNKLKKGVLYHYECYPNNNNNNNNNVGTLIGITSRLDFFSPICLLSFQCWAAFEVSLGDEGWQSLCNSLSNAIYYLLLEP